MDELLGIVGSSYRTREQMYESGKRWCDRVNGAGLLSVSSVLDYGAGLGRVAWPLVNDYGLDVTAYDTDCRMRHELRRLGICVVDELPSVGGWDLGICLYVLQHLTWNQARSLLRLLSSLVSRLIFSVPTYEQWNAVGEPVPDSYTDLVFVTAEMEVLHGCSKRSWIVHEDRIRELVCGTGFSAPTSVLSRKMGNYEVRSEVL
jgi:SAM-dependent methyltransferase